MKQFCLKMWRRFKLRFFVNAISNNGNVSLNRKFCGAWWEKEEYQKWQYAITVSGDRSTFFDFDFGVPNDVSVVIKALKDNNIAYDLYQPDDVYLDTLFISVPGEEVAVIMKLSDLRIPNRMILSTNPFYKVKASSAE